MASSENVFGVANYYSLWSQSIAETMSQFTGRELVAEVAEHADGPTGECLWATFTVSDALLGEQAFSVVRADAMHLSQLFIGENLDPNAEFTPDHADAFAELFRQFAGTVALQLKSILGQECPVRFKDTNEPAWNSAETAVILLKTEPPVTIGLRMDTGLLNSVTKIHVAAPEAQTVAEAPAAPKPAVQAVEQPQPGPDVEVSAAAASSPGLQRLSRTPINDKNLDLLLDVELEVSIRFGRRVMMLKDVLELSSGVMVELDRRVHDPIELLLGDRVIARGEAVIVDGNYGIRITEVIAHSQRLAEIA